MKRLKPIMKSIIYGLLIFAGSTYAARTYYANDVVYANKSGINITVDDALDDLYYASSNFANPTGTVISYIAGNEAPEGYLKCDGTVYKISDYPKLAEALKKGFGKYNYYGGDGETTFAVPDLRGEFLRGTGTNSHANSGNGSSVGVHQNPTYAPSGYMTSDNGNLYLPWGNNSHTIRNYDSIANISHNTTSVFYKTTSENSTYDGACGDFSYRPTNTSVLYCIKY